jgi:CRP/FNR family transcriptional regulator, cyclic AMP receptor protein
VVPLLPPLDFARPRRFTRGEYLTSAGAATEAVYLLRRGHVRIFILSPDGQESVTAVLGPGHLVGIGALLGRATHHAFAQALSTVDTYVLPSTTLQARMLSDSAVLGLVMGGVAQRLALEQALLRDAVLLPGSERLRDVAVRLPRADGTMTAATLAGLLGLRPETLSRLSHRRAAGQGLPAAKPDHSPKAGQPRHGRRTLPPGTCLPTGHSECIILIWSGRVRLFVGGGNGRELYIATLGAGDLLNLAGALGTAWLELRATAETSTVIQEMRASEFLAFLESDPAMVRVITRRLIDRLVALDERSARARAASTTELLASRLHELAAADVRGRAAQSWTEISGRWTHIALAHEIGRTRESVTRALAELERAGYLRREGRRLLVHRRRVAQDFNVLADSIEQEALAGV